MKSVLILALVVFLVAPEWTKAFLVNPNAENLARRIEKITVDDDYEWSIPARRKTHKPKRRTTIEIPTEDLTTISDEEVATDVTTSSKRRTTISIPIEEPTISDEEVDTDVTTSNDEPDIDTTLNPETTETSATTTPTYSCLPGQTAITKSDLKLIIKYVANQHDQEFELLNETLSENAHEILEKHTTKFNYLVKRITNRPKHLQHILQYVVEKRINLQPAIAKVNKAIEKHAYIFEDLKSVELKENKLLKNFNLCEQICTNCLEPSLRMTPYFKEALKNDEDNNEEMYCGKIAEVEKRITDSTKSNLKDIENQATSLIRSLDETIAQALYVFNDTFINLTLNKFSWTMYNVMIMLDEYDHLKDEVNEIAIDDSINKNMRNYEQAILELRNRIENAESDVRRVQLKCISCNTDTLHHYGLLGKLSAIEAKLNNRNEDLDLPDDYHNEDITFDEEELDKKKEAVNDIGDEDNDNANDEQSEKDLLEILLAKYYADRTKWMSSYIEDMFQDIINSLKQGPSKYIDEMEPVQKELEEMIKSEYNLFEDVQQSFPVQKIAQLGGITTTIEKIQNKVNEIIEKLKEMGQ